MSNTFSTGGDGNRVDLTDAMTLDEEAEYERMHDMEEAGSPSEFLADLAIEGAKDAVILTRALSLLIAQYEAMMRAHAGTGTPLSDTSVRLAHNQVCGARLKLATAGFGEEDLKQ